MSYNVYQMYYADSEGIIASFTDETSADSFILAQYADISYVVRLE